MSEANPHGLKLDQPVIVETYPNCGTPVSYARLEIVSIDSGWARLSDGRRASVEGLELDGGDFVPPGRVWLQSKDLIDYLHREAVTQAIREAHRDPLSELLLDVLLSVAEQLEIEVPPRVTMAELLK